MVVDIIERPVPLAGFTVEHDYFLKEVHHDLVRGSHLFWFFSRTPTHTYRDIFIKTNYFFFHELVVQTVCTGTLPTGALKYFAGKG